MESVTDKELADLEKQINEKNEALANETPSPADVVETPTAESIPVGQPEAVAAPDSVNPGEEAFKNQDLAKKKSWEKPEDAIKSYEELEKAFHAKNAELKRLQETQGYQPQYAPPPPPPPGAYYPPPAAYAPPPYQYAPPPPPSSRFNEQQMAASYGMDVEDFRKVVALSQDVSEAKQRALAADMARWREDINRQQQRNSDMTSILSDPAFHHPDVQTEMHAIFEKNPNLFKEPTAYSTALKEALSNIGRKNMTRGNAAQPSMSLPTEPPKTAGSGRASGSSVGRKVGALPDIRDFEKMTPENQEKALKSLGAFKTYEDMA